MRVPNLLAYVAHSHSHAKFRWLAASRRPVPGRIASVSHTVVTCYYGFSRVQARTLHREAGMSKMMRRARVRLTAAHVTIASTWVFCSLHSAAPPRRVRSFCATRQPAAAASAAVRNSINYHLCYLCVCPRGRAHTHCTNTSALTHRQTRRRHTNTY